MPRKKEERLEDGPVIKAFYCSQKRAEKEGPQIIQYYRFSREESVKLRNYYDLLADGKKDAGGLIVDLVTGFIEKVVESFLIGKISGHFVDDMKTKEALLMEKFDNSATNNNDPVKIRCFFKYRPHGSNDGAYWLEDIRVYYKK
ncbi:MAG: hypothetical protein ACRC76_14930 [Proteocatella sp.]